MARIDDSGVESRPALGVLRRDSNLKLIASPVVTSENEKARIQSMGLSTHAESDVEQLGFRYRDDHDCPEFVRHSSSTNYELFYDLWFVANLEVFSSSKGVTKESDLYAYIGYLSILWFTWFLVGMFDVRFVTDSIFERIIRTAHLGVMVGFSVVVTYFDPKDQEQGPFHTLSNILTVSRLVLFLQYCTIIWHIRRYKEGKWPLFIAGAVHLISAMIFFGIGFRFSEGRNSRVYVVWYIVSACEALIQLGLSWYYRVLTFSKTHLTERMTVLTVIILGAGVTGVAKNVVLIVKNAAGWTSATIGVLTCAIATMYFFFMIYFDWMNHHHLSGWRQLLWSVFHFPFHVALLLFMEGATQFMVWWKVHEVNADTYNEFFTLFDRLSSADVNITSDLIADELQKTIDAVFSVYHSTYTLTTDRIAELLSNIRTLPQGLWDTDDPKYNSSAEQFEYDLAELLNTITNSLYVNFNVDPFEGIGTNDTSVMQDVAIEDLNTRYYTVFEYTYVTAGLVLILMTIMYAITKKQGWTPFVIFRTALFGLMGLGVALVELISRNEERSVRYLVSPWLLPTICLVFFIVLLLSHLPHPPPFFFGRRKKSEHSAINQNNTAYTSVQVREVGPDVNAAYNEQGYDPYRWGNARSNVYMQPTPEMTYHNAYGQTGDFGMASPPLTHK